MLQQWRSKQIFWTLGEVKHTADLTPFPSSGLHLTQSSPYLPRSDSWVATQSHIHVAQWQLAAAHPLQSFLPPPQDLMSIKLPDHALLSTIKLRHNQGSGVQRAPVIACLHVLALVRVQEDACTCPTESQHSWWHNGSWRARPPPILHASSSPS